MMIEVMGLLVLVVVSYLCGYYIGVQSVYEKLGHTAEQFAKLFDDASKTIERNNHVQPPVITQRSRQVRNISDLPPSFRTPK